MDVQTSLRAARASSCTLQQITFTNRCTAIGHPLTPQCAFSSSSYLSRHRNTRLCATGGDDKQQVRFLAPSPEISAAVDTPLFRIWLPIGVVLGFLMLIDAAYSGDWSRIGAITKEQELQLQGIVPIAFIGHGMCAATAGAISAKRGENWVPRAAKTMASGFVGLVEVILLPES